MVALIRRNAEAPKPYDAETEPLGPAVKIDRIYDAA
jgi:hypothetical protein